MKNNEFDNCRKVAYTDPTTGPWMRIGRKMVLSALMLCLVAGLMGCASAGTDAAETTAETTAQAETIAEPTAEIASEGTEKEEDVMSAETTAASDPRFKEYAELLINTGLNVQPGREVFITASPAHFEFARMCSAAAYEAGASNVNILYLDETIDKQRYENADDAVFDDYPDYMATFYNSVAHKNGAILSIRSNDPNLLADVDSNKIARFNSSRAAKRKDYRSATNNNDVPWSIGAVPNPAWAMTVFPELSEEDAIDALWDAILETVRVTGDGTSEQKWDDHINDMDFSAKKMNSYDFKSLHYTNSLGTDFTVDLPEGHIWSTGGSTTSDGSQKFVANMPTEEIFTAPLKECSNGVIYASMPLILNGVTIKDIRFEVKDGKIVGADASTGLDVLKNELAMDEGASYLGELALVPYDSPISNQQILYYDTLFDENASCHIAFGDSYPECIENGTSMSSEELAARGMNSSDAHVDFMVGTSDLKIVGTTHDGTEVVVFENGNFSPAFTE